VLSGDRVGEFKGVIKGNDINYEITYGRPGEDPWYGDGTWSVSENMGELNGIVKVHSSVYRLLKIKLNLAKIE